MRMLIALVGNILALLATTIVPGITFRGNLLTLIVAGLILGLFNAIIRPIALLLSIPFLILSLGLVDFVLNGILLVVVSWLIPGYRVRDLAAGITRGVVRTVVDW